jgi:hypothetical protein
MSKTVHQTVVVPPGEEGVEFLRRLLTPTDGDRKKAWAEAYAASPGHDIVIEETEEEEHCMCFGVGCPRCMR